MTNTAAAGEVAAGEAAEIAAEQRHVDRVYARWEEVRLRAAEVEADGHRRAALGNFGALYERDVMVHQATRRLRSLDAEHDGLVFGRLDLRDAEVRHVGRLGLRDADYEPLVIDWRAPAAAAFYQATAEEPMGVVRRRVISSAGTRVTGVSDDLLDPAAAPPGMAVVGEGALMAALSQARGTTMRDIVATIQREQDDAIRAPASGATLITGGPGTGKTAVALHRVASLLYRDRRRFEAGGVLLVGPSPAFMRYIERVLPSLGEESVALRALGELVDGVQAVRRDPPACAAVKGSARMRQVLRRAIRDAPPTAPTRLRVVYGGEVLTLDEAVLSRARRSAHQRGAKPNAARAYAVEELLEELWRTAMGWADPPSHWDRSHFDEEIRDRGAFGAFVRAWWPMLAPTDVLSWFVDPARVRRYAAGVLAAPEIDALAASYRRTGDWSVADVALLDELRVLLGTPPRPVVRRRRPEPWEMREITLLADRGASERRPVDRDTEGYALVVVDEAQDLSPMQWRMLARRGPRASWTVVGDPAQSSWFEPDGAGSGRAAGEAEAARDAALGRRPRHTFTLTTNYRNSAEIFAFAAAVLRRADPDAALPHAVRPTGVQPDVRVIGAAGRGARVRAEAEALLIDVAGTVGVVTPRGRLDEVAAAVAGLGESRLSVLDSIDAKGLEYDGVVVVEPGEIAAESPAGTRVLYVALTRATHRLTVVTSDPAWPARAALTG